MMEMELESKIGEIFKSRKYDKDCKTPRNECVSMSKPRIMKNIITLSFALILHLSAYHGLEILQSTMNSARNVGVISQSLIYAAMVISALFLAKLVIEKIGCKNSIAFSILLHVPYFASDFHPMASILLPLALFFGAGGGILGSSGSTYINRLSFMEAKGDTEKAVLSTFRLFGISQIGIFTSQIWGNLITFYVLQPTNAATVFYPNASIGKNFDVPVANSSCGAEFCGGIADILQPVPDSQRHVSYCGLSLLSTAIVAIFMDSVERKEQKENAKGEVFLKLTASFRQMKKIDQLLLALPTAYIGLAQGFLFGDFTQAYVACALGSEVIGLVFVCYGIVSSATCLCTVVLARFVNRTVLFVTATINKACLLLALFIWNPDGRRICYYVITGLWGFSDAIYLTQILGMHGDMFRSNEEAAFATLEAFRYLGLMLGFACSSTLCITPKIYMMTGALIIGFAGYIAVEMRNSKKKHYVLH